ncbi:S-layer homology domain-containing protein [Paenibacillus sp. N3.4]|uniref:S-layer homology domain-containing protein n=1 Tax=Paenibacillus sp. N3.4 TaxID=2603222 RepID=UPI0011C95BDC|nr:S-layer homology domain-containing protein [Paenibacillus sp. N3.4]TXK71830.1 hypothetical protein FU659_32335 [Paenibacillus sp. N3.4]
MRKEMIAAGLSLVLLLVLPVSAGANESNLKPQTAKVNLVNFTDVTATYWGFDAILWGVDNKIVDGYPDGTFKPDIPVKQSEFLAMLLKAYKAKIETPSNNDAWDTYYLKYAEEHNWRIIGDSQKVVDRGQIAKLLTNAAGKNLNLMDSIHYLLDAGLSNGKTERSIVGYRQNDSLTRAESLAFIKNILNKLDILKAAPKNLEKYENPNSDIVPVTEGRIVSLKDVEPTNKSYKIGFRKELKPFEVDHSTYQPSINDLSGALGVETDFSLKSRYVTFIAKLAVDDNYKYDFLKVEISNGKRLFYSNRLTRGEAPKTIELDVTGVDRLIIKTGNFEMPEGAIIGFSDPLHTNDNSVHIYDITLSEIDNH